MPEQLDLFGAPKPPPIPEPDPELVRLAAGVPGHVHFGTSSWTFPGWKGLVYQRAYRNQKQFVRESLAEYARYPLFRTVGVDRSYYAPLTAEELREYRRQLPPAFPCCLKVWQDVATAVFPRHPRYGDRAGMRNPGFLDPIVFAEQVVAPLQAEFADHVGALILEIPPTNGAAEAREIEAALDRFLAAYTGPFHIAVELRERRLLTGRYLSTLRAHGASHVLSYWSRMPPLRDQLGRAGVMPGPKLVVRLLLPPGLRYDDTKKAYDPFDRIVEPQPRMRDDVMRIVWEAGENGYPVFVLANNKAEGSSPLTIRALAERFADAPPWW